MIPTQWYVITGAPCSGKTTLINRLSTLGYHTAAEAAREYIEQQLAHKLDLAAVRGDNVELQYSIFNLMQQRERLLEPDELTFFDRGLPDSIAYFQFHTLDYAAVLKECNQHAYKKVFYCHSLPLILDAVRNEDNESAQQIGQLIYTAYTNLGYTLIELPSISVEERLKIILSHI